MKRIAPSAPKSSALTTQALTLTTLTLTTLALMTLALAGCETVGPASAPPPPPPPPVELGQIVGNGAFHAASGGSGTCAGLSVALLAETEHTRARMLALYGSASHAVEPVALVKARSLKLPANTEQALTFSAKCDAGGHFSLTGLPGGPYFLIARVTIQPAEHGSTDLVILQHLTLRVGETRVVTLAD